MQMNRMNCNRKHKGIVEHGCLPRAGGVLAAICVCMAFYTQEARAQDGSQNLQQGGQKGTSALSPMEDPENLARYGYSPQEIRMLYRRRKLNAREAEGEARVARGDYDGAIAIYQAVEAEDPDNEWRRHLFAEAYAGKGDVARAIDYYRRAIYRQYNNGNATFAESNPRLMMQFALLLLQTRQYDEALAAQQQAMKYYTASYGPSIRDIISGRRSEQIRQLPFVAQLIIAVGYLGNNDEKSALVHAREAVRLQPDAAIGHLYLAQILDCQGTYDQKQLLTWKKEARLEMETAAKTGTGAVKEYAEDRLDTMATVRSLDTFLNKESIGNEPPVTPVMKK